MDPLVETLLSAGLIERDGAPRRGRAAGITITSTGLDKLTRIRPAVSDLNQPERFGIGTDQLPLLVAQLRAIRAQLQA